LVLEFRKKKRTFANIEREEKWTFSLKESADHSCWAEKDCRRNRRPRFAALTDRPLACLRVQGVTKQIGGSVHELAAKVDEYARGMISGPGSSLFEELGLYYIGPVDGHNIDDLITILNDVKSTKTTGPVLIHVVTEKGRGYPYAERAADKYHGIRTRTT